MSHEGDIEDLCLFLVPDIDITYFLALRCVPVCSCPSSSGISSYRSVSSSEKIFAVVQVSKAGTGAGSLLFRATTYGTLLISPSSPSSWFRWWRFRPWSPHGLLAWTYLATVLWNDIGPCGPLSVFSHPLGILVDCPGRESVCHHL